MGNPSGRKERESIFQVLKNDHARILRLFRRLEEETDPASREDFLSDIESELHLHMALEEDIFYPVVGKKERHPKIITSYYSGHANIRNMLALFLNTASDEELWMGRVRELKELFQIHTAMEEERLFTLARKILLRQQPFEMAQFFLREKQLQVGVPA